MGQFKMLINRNWKKFFHYFKWKWKYLFKVLLINETSNHNVMLEKQFSCLKLFLKLVQLTSFRAFTSTWAPIKILHTPKWPNLAALWLSCSFIYLNNKIWLNEWIKLNWLSTVLMFPIKSPLFNDLMVDDRQ